MINTANPSAMLMIAIRLMIEEKDPTASFEMRREIKSARFMNLQSSRFLLFSTTNPFELA